MKVSVVSDYLLQAAVLKTICAIVKERSKFLKQKQNIVRQTGFFITVNTKFE